MRPASTSVGSSAHRFRVDLTGRTALVTGASSGIGRRFATVLAENGANVVIGARRYGLLDELKSSIETSGGRALAVTMDVSDEGSIIAAYDEASRHFGAVDTVIANAGVIISGSPLKMSAADFDKIMAVNLRGVFLTAREGARRMAVPGPAAACRGRIVIISSITADRPYHGISAYSASKAAVVQLGRVLAKDCARKGINVNTLCPGFMETELTHELWDTDFGRQLLDSFPRKRMMGPEALDGLLLYLSSDWSAEITGSVFTIDDGQSLA
jgi:NAD(P)-dependent dehydrogenase (short-subunit alcohol dehydrogenase family)